MRQYNSRLTRVENEKSIKSALVFGILTILVIIIALFFGIKFFSKFASLFVKNEPSTTTREVSTLVAPNLAPLEPYTNKEILIVKGTGQPNAKVKIFFGSSSDETVIDDSGNFAMNVSLAKGKNTIYAKIIDDKGNESPNSNTMDVIYTTQIPNLTINSPQNNQNYFSDSQRNITIQGSTDPGNTVTINDHIAIVDPTGKFNFSFTLQNGDNQLKITSVDQAGNKKEIELKVTFSE